MGLPHYHLCSSTSSTIQYHFISVCAAAGARPAPSLWLCQLHHHTSLMSTPFSLFTIFTPFSGCILLAWCVWGKRRKMPKQALPPCPAPSLANPERDPSVLWGPGLTDCLGLTLTTPKARGNGCCIHSPSTASTLGPSAHLSHRRHMAEERGGSVSFCPITLGWEKGLLYQSGLVPSQNEVIRDFT